MKCPKCNYLGFETGDRCKNCGYDFSLSLTEASSPEDVEVDLTLEVTDKDTAEAPAWVDEVDRALGEPPDVPEPQRMAEAPPFPAPQPFTPQPLESRHPEPLVEAARSPLPLFSRTEDADDEPLIKLPSAPRPPLAVRRTPETPRLRAVPKALPPVTPELELEFAEPPSAAETPLPASIAPTPDEDSFRPVRAPAMELVAAGEPSGAGARLAAAAIDHVILGAIDVAVVYLTLRMAELSMADWLLLPVAPLAAFLLLLKISYFCAFTAIGGQTIGKMAMGIRVVTDAGAPVDGACAVRRTAAGTISTLLLGLGFIPALIGSERRALHDRLARTRVVDLHSV